MILILAFIATIPAANWMIGHVGTCTGQGPCVIPVGFGLMAPSGVLLIGIALALRDEIQNRYGPTESLAAVAFGTIVSTFVAPQNIVAASACAYLISELADFAVYTPLSKRHMWLAVLLSGFAGAVIDSVIFLSLAFGSLTYLEGQAVGKIWASLAFAAWIFARRHSSNA